MYWRLWVGRVQWGPRCDVLQTRHWYLRCFRYLKGSPAIEFALNQGIYLTQAHGPSQSSPRAGPGWLESTGHTPCLREGLFWRPSQLQIIIGLAEATVGTESVVQLLPTHHSHPPSALREHQPSMNHLRTCLSVSFLLWLGVRGRAEPKVPPYFSASFSGEETQAEGARLQC